MLRIKDKSNIFKYLMAIIVLLGANNAFANWTMNVGYQNPPGAKIGVNFLYWGSSDFLYELGVGGVAADVDTNEDNEVTDSDLWVSGGANIKYLFMNSDIAPYVEGGFHTGLHLDFDDGINMGAGNLYGGLGMILGKADFYFYLGAFTHGESFAGKLGLGWDI